MGAGEENRSISIEGSAVGSAIVSGNGNIVYVIHQVVEKRRKPDRKDAIGPNPYMGLAKFSTQDADRYFGREAQVDRLWQRLQDLYEQSVHQGAAPRFLPILGPSGSGKSSLMLAGLIPELARRPLPSTSSLRVVVLRPRTRPLESLAEVLAKAATDDPMPLAKTEEFAAVLASANSAGDHDGLRRIANLLPKIHDAPLVVLVDQFEEVYSYEPKGDNSKQKEKRELFIKERTAFIDNLLIAAQDPSCHVSVVITLRSDFLRETQRHQGLNQIIGSDQSVIVPAMTAAELRRAIDEPAKQAGHSLSEAIVGELVRDVEGREGALPLLQFALSQMWEGLRKGHEPLTTYLEIGRVGGALADKAGKIYDGLSVSEKAIAERVFVGLVQLGESTRDTRRQVKIKDLITRKDSLEQVREVVHKFSVREARLITLSTVGKEEIAEVTHEALFDHWQAVKGWIDSRRDDIRLQRRLEAAASHWDEQKRPAGLLWRPPDLDLLRPLVKTSEPYLNRPSVDFFRASERAERQQQLLKRLGIVGLIAGLVLTTGLSAFAGYQVRRAERRQIQLYEAEARNLAESNPVGSLVSGLAAIGLGHNPLVKLPQIGGEGLVSSAVLDLNNPQARFNWVAAGHQTTVESVAVSADGATIVSGGRDGTVRLWDWTGKPIGEPFISGQDQVWSVAISPDGETIVSGGRDGTVRLWDRMGQPIGEPFISDQGAVCSLVISPDGATIVSGSLDGTVRLWDRTGQPIGKPFISDQGAVCSLVISPDGATIVSGSLDGTVRLWDRTGQPIGKPFISDQSQVLVAISPDGETIVSGGEDGTVRLWDRMGQPIGKPFISDQGLVWSVAISPDGETIVSGGEDGTVRLWDRTGRAIGEPFVIHQGEVRSMVISSDGETIVSGGEDGTVRLWIRTGQPIGEPFISDQDQVRSVAISPDEDTIVSGSSDGTVRLWDRMGQPIGEPFMSEQDPVLSVAISQDGDTIVSGSSDGTVRLWDRMGQPIGEPFMSEQDPVLSVAISQDGDTIVSGSLNSKLRLWDRMGQPIGEPFMREQGGIGAVAISPDGETIVSGSYYGGTVRLWDRMGQPIGEPLIRSDQGTIWSVAISPDGETIVSVNRDEAQIDTVWLWDRMGQPIGEPFMIGRSGLKSVAISPDGETIISGSLDGTVRLWPVGLVEEGRLSRTCDQIRGYLLARSSEDETVRLARRTCERFAGR